jgi:hypothetical protein
MRKPIRSRRSRGRSTIKAGSLAGPFSARSLFSILSFLSVGSILSFGSVLSMGSVGSMQPAHVSLWLRLETAPNRERLTE